jgi:hypothetical protein
MALVQEQIQLAFTYIDANRRKGYAEFKMDPGTTLADANAKAATVAPLISALTPCLITGYRIIAGTVETTAPANAATGADAENKGVFLVRAANGLRSKIQLPGVDPAVLLPNQEDIDLTNADVASFVTELVTGGPLPPNPRFCNVHGSDLETVQQAYLYQRNSYLNKRQKKG